MKKRIYIILLLLAIILTGCSAGKKELIGTWSGEADVTQLVKDVLESNEEDEFADYLSIPELKLDCTVTFTTLSTFRVEIGKTSVEVMVAKIQEILKKAIEDYLNNEIQKEGRTATLEEILASQNTSIDEIISEIIPDGTVDDILKDASFSGQFTVRNRKLMISYDENSKPSAQIYYLYDIVGENLYIHEGTEELGVSCPLKLRKY